MIDSVIPTVIMYKDSKFAMHTIAQKSLKSFQPYFWKTEEKS